MRVRVGVRVRRAARGEHEIAHDARRVRRPARVGLRDIDRRDLVEVAAELRLARGRVAARARAVGPGSGSRLGFGTVRVRVRVWGRV